MLLRPQVFMLGWVRIKSTEFFDSLNDQFNINIKTVIISWTFFLEEYTENWICSYITDKSIQKPENKTKSISFMLMS